MTVIMLDIFMIIVIFMIIASMLDDFILIVMVIVFMRENITLAVRSIISVIIMLDSFLSSS